VTVSLKDRLLGGGLQIHYASLCRKTFPRKDR
jgi:hypothetical protein